GLVGGGGLAQRVVAHERELFAVPDALDDQAAAAAPEAFLTAFDAICLQAALASGDTLLVNGASGGVGTAAVQIAVHLGARVVANVRSEELRPRVAELGATALPADEAFARVQEEGGADVVLELVGAPHMAGNIASLARGGRIIVVGSKPGDEAAIVLRDLMSRRGHLIGTTLRTRPLEEKAHLVQEFGRRIVPAMAAGRPSRRLRPASTCTSRSRSRARSRTRSRSWPRRTRPTGRCAPLATSGTQPSCWQMRGRRSRASGWGCSSAATTARSAAGRGS